jgi:hypothetical protein
MASDLARAVAHVEKAGILLVFSVNNRPKPASLWSALHPRTKMKWEWDQEGDFKVADLWHLRAKLATSRKVVYAKWYRGRATLFSKPVFTAMLAELMAMRPQRALDEGLSREARNVLELLEESSPQSTKQLRIASDLQGRYLESAWTRAMKELWSRMSIVGVGEVEDGAFPSLAVGATRLMFEEMWIAARDRSEKERAADRKKLDALFAREPLFARVFAEARAGLEKPSENP